jgi:hypothetical protein
MADVERIAGGRRAVSLLLPADESSIPFSAMLGCRVEVGVGVFVEDTEKEAAGVDSSEVTPDDEEGVIVAAEDCERWRMAMSAGLLRRSWLLEERWPGVCDRGIRGVRSCASAASWSSEGGGRGLVGDTWAIFCERTTLMFCGDCGGLSRPAALPWSAMVRSNGHVLNTDSMGNSSADRRPGNNCCRGPVETGRYASVRRRNGSADGNVRGNKARGRV